MPAKEIKKKCAGTFPSSDRYDNGRKTFRQTDPSGKNREDVSDFRQREDPASEEYPGKDTIQYQKRDSKRQRDLKDPEKISEYESKQGHILVKQESAVCVIPAYLGRMESPIISPTAPPAMITPEQFLQSQEKSAATYKRTPFLLILMNSM